MPQIVGPDRSLSYKTRSRFFMCFRTYLGTPGAATSLWYFVRGLSPPISYKKALDMSRQRARILFTILTKVAILLVPSYWNTVKRMSPCSVSIAVISLLSTGRGTCSYPMKKSISNLITCPANLSLNSSTFSGRPASLTVSLFCYVKQDISLYPTGFFFFMKNARCR